MKVPYALLVATVVVVVVDVVLASDLSHRDERILFASNPLVCEGDAGHQGACLPYFRCDNYGGTVEGNCRAVGQCCVVQRSCDEEASARIIYFNSERLSISDGTTCSVTVNSSSKTSIAAPDICQLHVTLVKMKLSEPTAEGACEDQYLEVRGGNKDSMKICGNGNNQTLVVDVKGNEGPFKVSVVSVQDNPDSEWEVKVVQVPCNTDAIAPDHCDLYLTGVTGEVKSFNYDTKPSSRKQDNDKPGSRHLQESYSICVRREEGYCSLKWTTPSEDVDKYAFTLTGNLAPGGIEPVFGTAVDLHCPKFTDYLVVTDAHIEGEEDAINIICGSKFPPAVYSYSFKIDVEANDKEFTDEDIDNRGFHLLYEQQKC